MAKRISRHLGLDLGHHTLKAVEIEGTDRSNWRVTGVGVAPTPPESVADGVVANPQALSDAIRDLLRHNNLTAKLAYTSISGPAVTFRPLRLPRMNESQLRKAVLFKAREAPTPTPLEEMVVEFDVSYSNPDSADVDIFMVAAPRAIVESRADAINDSGLVLETMDLEGFSLMRALVECSPDPSDLQKTMAIVSIGHTNTEFNIVTHGTFSFPRPIAMGGSHFNHTLRSSLGLDEPAVEEMKHLMDVRPLLSVDPYAAGGQSPEHLLRPGLEELVREITRSVNYYQSQFAEGTPDASVDLVVLCGGGARLQGIQEYMSARLRTEVRVADPLRSFFEANPSPELDLVRDYSPALSCALGLALYSLPI